MSTMVNSSIARDIWPITKHATNPVGGAGNTRRAFGVRVEGAGNLVCRTEGGIADVTIAMAAGETLPVVITHVRDTSTVTGIFGYSLWND